ncbi:PREDICTED: vesicle transport through interaction with t-SNAREs homolog 1A, partial [Eurypyga helias]|uniref:vesicle transport through interaction with t-SNAREs homolog 1A n=1 Tax=Eurypyga helias TaxID=54383 RepID=UPI0005288BF3
NICKIFASSSPEVPVSSCGEGWESLKRRIVRWEGDVRRDAHEVAVFSSSDLREIADGLLPPRWKKQDERYEKKQMVANVEKQLEEARELLEQMELEVREIPPQSRGMYSSRMRSYKQEMGKLEADFKRSRIAYSDEVRNELLGDDGNSSENQLIKLREERAHLLDNTERLERSSRRLEAGYQIAVETGARSVLLASRLIPHRSVKATAHPASASRVIKGIWVLRTMRIGVLTLLQSADGMLQEGGNANRLCNGSKTKC